MGRDEGTLTEPTGGGASSSDAADFGYVELTRFAAQQIYAPKRLAEQTPGISKVPLPATGQPTGAFYRGGDVTTTPVASWRGQSGLYVTAVNVFLRINCRLTRYSCQLILEIYLFLKENFSFPFFLQEFFLKSLDQLILLLKLLFLFSFLTNL